jgi:hypothetical protein
MRCSRRRGGDEVDANLDIPSYFEPTRGHLDNAVFDPARLDELLGGFEEAHRDGRTVMYCAKGWEVRPNRQYNIQGYDGLAICWIYNDNADAWWTRLPKDVQTNRAFENFPHYATFFENAPKIIDLDAPQVNALAQFSAWNLTNAVSRGTIERFMGGALTGCADTGVARGVAPWTWRVEGGAQSSR